MKIRNIIYTVLISLCVLANAVLAEEAKPIQLPAPDMRGGKPLMQTLRERKSSREFSSKPLPSQVISDLLWAAFGVNRPESKGRTAPAAMDCQEIDIYVAMQSGLFLYEPFENMLIPVSPEDIRAVTGKQPFVKDAPVNLIYVADLSKAEKMGKNAEFFAACDTGFISENAYLYCASSGLSTVVRGWFDEKELARAMKLKPSQKIILTQTVGYQK
ncbi:MAG: SagB/ThcOx family dehydrogenase [Candidatus Omnitrophota bacterium]